MAQSVHELCVVAVQQTIQGLTLPGLASGSVFALRLPTDRKAFVGEPPFVVCAPPGQETSLPGTDQADDYGYPVNVTLVDASDQDLTLDNDRVLVWRQLIRNAFHNKRLSPAVTDRPPGSYLCKVEFGTVIDPGLFENANLEVSQLVVRVITRELRS